MKRLLKLLLKLFLALIALAVLAVLGAKLILHRPTPKAGEPPRGYSSTRQIIAAIALRELRLVEMNPPLPDGVAEQKGIEYGRVGERPLLLDLYSPARLTNAVPGLIFIHGGAWRSGKRQDYRVYTTHFASRGYVVATISYRLLKEAPFPAAVEDAKCAVRWMRANAARLQVDPDRIAVLGGSAGGHLAMMVGYSPDDPKLEGHGGNAGVSSRVAAVVNFYGPADLTTPFAKASHLVKDFLGGKFYAEAPELYRQASPQFYLKAGAPPTLTFHGTTDEVVPIDQADSLTAKLQELKIPCEYARLEGWPHAMDAGQPVNNYCKARVEAFLAKHLAAR
jgi:acetyl esterase/lipase